MQLVAAHVTHFRSVEDSGQFSVAPVTCLVGKNEAGKSAVLLALAALNPHEATPASLNKERDYPRRWLTQYDARHADGDAQAVHTTWRLDAGEAAQIADVAGQGVLKSDLVSICRRYGQELEIEVSLDYAKAIEQLYRQFELDEAETAALGSPATTSALIEVLGKLTTRSTRLEKLHTHLQANGSVSSQVRKWIRAFMPKFMYFAAYDRMDGAIQLEQTKALIANNQLALDANRGVRLFKEFLDVAGIAIDDITAVATYETFNAKLQAASNSITDQVLEYWTQNPDLSVEVRIEQARPGDAAPLNSGTIARARIINGLHRADTPFSERSAGFVWFFSFLVKFAQVKKDTSSVVLLLDEPGLTLHGKAQADLLRFFKEKLAPHHQIIYSTHSPFMVPADELPSVRIVEDQVELKNGRRVPIGTKVREDVLTKDPDTLFPLQGALGYEVSQSLFVGKRTLLVEGPSDILYLHALSNALQRRQRQGLDRRWTICPSGGIDKIQPFVALFGGNSLHVAVLSDQAVGDRKKIEALRKSAILRAGHFYTVADFVERDEADVEDLFEPELFAEILNKCYSLAGEDRLTASILASAEPSTARVVKQAEAAFRVKPHLPLLDHFTPADWLLKNSKALDVTSRTVSATLDRAEKVFVALNGLIESNA